jgi:AcrR family transcriptional regulator
MGQAATERAQARAEAQRERILEAAQACFVEHGFHAANMSGIAESAGMSAGLIYRYFASKNEIILAIIERQLELTRAEIAKLHGSADLVLDIWKSMFQPVSNGNRMQPGLYAEMSAEAARDAQIGAAVACSDRLLRDEVGEWLARDRGLGGIGLTPAHSRNVSLLLQCLVDGLRLRQLREPDLDPALVKRALRELLAPWLR